jgi:hypothetical protein
MHNRATRRPTRHVLKVSGSFTMRETSQLTRRGALLLGCTGILGARTPFGGKESDFWNRKEPSQWSSEEIDRLITASPWAKQVKASAAPPAADVKRPDEPTIPGAGGRIGGISRPSIRIPVGGRGGKALFDVTVRWESARPVLEALKTPLADAFANHYVISVCGIPGSYATAQTSKHSDDDESPVDRMKSQTHLEGKRLFPVQAEVVQLAPGASTQTFLFGFPTDKLRLSLDDNEVTFVTQVEKSSIRAKFNLKEMIYRDTLAI